MSYEDIFESMVTESSLKVFLKERGCKLPADLTMHAARYLQEHGKTLESLPKRPDDKNISSVICNHPHGMF